ncbi:squalene/phytoene synthase family protein [Amphibacillus cookii]|uniref:squalene/phytoene synthase family protein n=1 Tax=Amphibacillus cookii TaxID=767787 RepID=UPI001EF8EFA3|nr:phytoene/squalene synthase family protein [Amphibacillus cookii]MBM7540767.1 farnesyl-diphosphate farnesyltransferase [Amphibacillus cookii]
MRSDNKFNKEAMRVLKETSRTFYIPITLLKPTLKKAVASAYLSMRAIDEIEDHEQLPQQVKAGLLEETSQLLLKPFDVKTYQQLIAPYVEVLPEVTKRLGDWLSICPDGIVDKVKASTSTMAIGMAKWVKKDWKIHTKEDLDDYTYYVAGLVGVMLSDIWSWYDDTETNQELAIGFGRGLQSVNILRNQDEDQERGVTFMPDGWARDDMFAYATENLSLAKAYMKDIDNRNIATFCKIPYKLAEKTLVVMRHGSEKMTRAEVAAVVEDIVND